MVKIACVITGPYRYLNLVVEQIKQKLSSCDVEFDIFIHIWKADLGNKVRGNDNLDISLLNDPKIKSFSFGMPYTEQEIINLIGHEPIIKAHSPINAMCGMFTAISTVYKIIEQLPDSKKYTHVLRLRTDISFNTDKLIPQKILDNTVYISENPLLPNGEISDHTMLCSMNDFKALWTYTSFHDFVLDYEKSYYNPEIYLKERVNLGDINVVTFWKRFIDYHVVYAEAKKNDPKLIKELDKPEDIFSTVYTDIDINDLTAFFDKIKSETNNPPLKNKISAFIKRSPVLKKIVNRIK
ncbi:TPA: hypothetical protein I7217_06550 [Vibrio vulnificus]|nr:hypothetical protein [Vibrio vulnificus]HAT8504042.1 hypothetical protein [Vibrio vulnificus]